MMPTRKYIMPKKFEAHQNVEAHQAPAMFFYDIKIGDECSNIKAMLPSREPTDMLCKLLKVQSAPDVDMECFDDNVLEYHYFMALFREVVESKIEDPRGKTHQIHSGRCQSSYQTLYPTFLQLRLYSGKVPSRKYLW